jgi:hypothetical protein
MLSDQTWHTSTNTKEEWPASPCHGVCSLQVLAALGGDGDEEVAVGVTVPARLVGTAAATIQQTAKQTIAVRADEYVVRMMYQAL